MNTCTFTPSTRRGCRYTLSTRCGGAGALARGRVCVELWWGESTGDPTDDGWVYAWGEPSDLASWVTAGISRPCGDGVPGVGEVQR